MPDVASASATRRDKQIKAAKRARAKLDAEAAAARKRALDAIEAAVSPDDDDARPSIDPTAPRLSVAQFRTLDGIRQATVRALAHRWPNEVLPLLVTLHAGGLIEVLRSPIGEGLVEVLNERLRDTRWRLTQRPAN
jgi:hypothetical protein